MSEISLSSTLNGYELTSTIAIPKSVRKYFNSSRLFANYNAPLKADTSILNIPLVSTIMPLAWLTGTNVHVDKLDRKYVEAMEAIRNEYSQMYPKGEFKAKIIVDDLVENQTGSQGTAMLFSGGVDSTYSLIKNVNLKPRLLMFEGVVGYQLDQSYRQHILLARKTYSDFARREGLAIDFVETNAISILNDGRITHDFHKALRETKLWLALQFPLVLLGIVAPLSIGRFNRLLIAASVDPTHDYEKYPHSSQPRIDEKFAWADLSVTHDGYVHRFSKTGLIKEYLEKHEYHLRVCNDPPLDRLNCSVCEKCFRTIAPLVLEGVDPNTCGFKVDESTFESLRRSLEKREFGDLVTDSFWKVFQTLIPRAEMKVDLFGSRDFFMWLKNLNIEVVQKKGNLHKDLYNTLPYSAAILYDAFYNSAHKQSIRPILNVSRQIKKNR